MFNIAALPAPSVDTGLSKYLAEIRKFPLLKPEQELAYAKLANTGIATPHFNWLPAISG
jgi:hypothetical protein